MLLSHVSSSTIASPGQEFEQPHVRADLLAAIAAAEQDDVHVELVPKLAVRQFLDKLGDDIDIPKCLYHLLVLLYITRHRKKTVLKKSLESRDHRAN